MKNLLYANSTCSFVVRQNIFKPGLYGRDFDKEFTRELLRAGVVFEPLKVDQEEDGRRSVDGFVNLKKQRAEKQKNKKKSNHRSVEFSNKPVEVLCR